MKSEKYKIIYNVDEYIDDLMGLYKEELSSLELKRLFLSLLISFLIKRILINYKKLNFKGIAMQIEINIKDNKSQMFLELLESLKDRVILDFEIVDEEKEIEKILNSRNKEDKEVAVSKIVEIDI